MPVEYEIINTSESPPNGWHYVQPESGRIFHHYAKRPFLDAIRDHRLANEYPISATWVQEIEDEMCRDHPEWGNSVCRRIGAKPGLRLLSFAATMSFLQMLGKWVTDGAPYVEQEVAEERAAICASCPNNVYSEFGCGNCTTKIQQIISVIGGKRSTLLDDKLHSCSICSCNLKAAVHFPLESQESNLTPEMKQELNAVLYCWKHYE